MALIRTRKIPRSGDGYAKTKLYSPWAMVIEAGTSVLSWYRNLLPSGRRGRQMNLVLFKNGRYRDYQGKVLWVTSVVIRHRDNRFIVMPGKYDFGGFIK